MKKVLLVGAGRIPRDRGYNAYPNSSKCEITLLDCDKGVNPDIVMSFEDFVDEYISGKRDQKFDYIIIDFSTVDLIRFDLIPDFYDVLSKKLLNERGVFAFWISKMMYANHNENYNLPNSCPNLYDIVEYSKCLTKKGLPEAEINSLLSKNGTLYAQCKFKTRFYANFQKHVQSGEFSFGGWCSEIDDLYDEYPPASRLPNLIFKIVK